MDCLLMWFLLILLRSTSTIKAELSTNISSSVLIYPTSSFLFKPQPGTEKMYNTQVSEEKSTFLLKNELKTSVYSIVSPQAVVTKTLPSQTTVPTSSLFKINKQIPTGTYEAKKTVSLNMSTVTSSFRVSGLNNSEELSPFQRQITPSLGAAKPGDVNITLSVLPEKSSTSIVTTFYPPRDSKMYFPLTSSSSHEFPSVVSKIDAGVNISVPANKTRENSAVSKHSEQSETIVVTSASYRSEKSMSPLSGVEIPTSNVKNRSTIKPYSTVAHTTFVSTQENYSTNEGHLPIPFSSPQTVKSSIKSEQNVTYSSLFSGNLYPHGVSSVRISSLETNAVNKTMHMEPSASFVLKPERSKITVASTTPLVNITGFTYTKLSEDVPSKIENFVLPVLSHTKGINMTKANIVNKSKIWNENQTIKIVASKFISPTRINLASLTMSKSPEYLDRNKTLHSTPISYMSSTLTFIASSAPFSEYIITTSSAVPSSGNVGEISTDKTQIQENISNTAVSTPSLSYKTDVSSRKSIQVSPSEPILRKTDTTNVERYSQFTTNSVMKYEISNSVVEIKPTSVTNVFIQETLQYSSASFKPTSTPVKRNVQQFDVTIIIGSEEFKEEYVKGTRAFNEKSKELIVGLFDKVFKRINEYVFTDVLRFFRGSLGCDAVIHTESDVLNPVSVKEIYQAFKIANNTQRRLEKYVINDIKVQERHPDKEAREEKETWGNTPIIVISILAGVCVVLLVLVISQCIRKRRYSHSLAESNELNVYSPEIHLKHNDDFGSKDEERMPMTTFHET